MQSIKHLVFSGGGPSALQILGAMEELSRTKQIDIHAIQTIYGTSAGAMIAAMICMKFDWDIIIDYVVNRPWQDVFAFQVKDLLSLYQTRGVFHKKVLEKMFFPLFASKDIPRDIQLKDFFLLTKIELHLFSFDVNQFVTEDISYLTYPNLSLIDALYMSSSIPMLMSPLIFDGKCFMDGGLFANYPLQYCIERVLSSGGTVHDILGFKNVYWEQNRDIVVTAESTVVDYLVCILLKIFHHFTAVSNSQTTIPNVLECKVQTLSLQYLQSFWESAKLRKEYIEKGKENVMAFSFTYK
jgi:predicted acylesterase/phospholipase RssA